MFCYSVIKVLCFLSKTINYIITLSSSCQELFSRTFFKNFFVFLRSPFSLSNMNFYILSHNFQSVKKFFRFLLRFLSFFFQKWVFHVQRILYYHNSRVASSIFWRFFYFINKHLILYFFCIFIIYVAYPAYWIVIFLSTFKHK